MSEISNFYKDNGWEDKMTIYQVKPIYDKTLWGNNFLTSARGITGENLGTSWEISFHDYGSNAILNNNKTLKNLLDENRQNLIGNTSYKSLLRLAFLDTKSKLSVQVHPTMDYAKKYLDDDGKYEAWYIVEAEPNAKLMAGCKIDDIEIFKRAIKNNSLEELLIYHSVKKGDYIYIAPGGIHALGEGILAIELSTNSNTTYRVYDYGRKDETRNMRELHLESALENIDLSIKPKVNHLPITATGKTIVNEFVKSEYFIWSCVDLVNDYAITNNEQPLYVTILDDNIEVRADEQIVKPKKYDHLFISARSTVIEFLGVGRLLIGQSV